MYTKQKEGPDDEICLQAPTETTGLCRKQVFEANQHIRFALILNKYRSGKQAVDADLILNTRVIKISQYK